MPRLLLIDGMCRANDVIETHTLSHTHTHRTHDVEVYLSGQLKTGGNRTLLHQHDDEAIKVPVGEPN